METVIEKTKSNEKEHSKNIDINNPKAITEFSPYKMTVNYDEKKMVIEYSEDFLHPHLLKHGEFYINQLLDITKQIDWHIRKGLSQDKATTKSRVCR